MPAWYQQARLPARQLFLMMCCALFTCNHPTLGVIPAETAFLGADLALMVREQQQGNAD